MSQVEEFEFEAEMDSQVAAEQAGAEAVANEAEPVVEVETEEVVVEETKAEEVETEKAEEAEPEVETTFTKKEKALLTGMMDERDKRQTLKDENAELKDRLKALETPESDVSIFEDEAAWKTKQDEKVQQEVRNVGLNMSQAFAEEAFGEDKVAAATKWMEEEGVKSPYIIKEFNEAKLPFHKLVKLHEAELIRQNPDSYVEELVAKRLAELEKKTPEPPIKSSLASKRSAGEQSQFPDSDEDILNE